MTQRPRLLCLSLLLGTGLTMLSVAATGVQRSEPRAIRSTQAATLGDDRFAVGSSVRIERTVAGDAIAAGGQVDVAAEVRGDAIVAGGNVRVAARVGKSVYAAGGQVTVAGAVYDNVRAAGGEVLIVRDAEVGANASLAGGRVEVDGVIGGYLQAAGGEVIINGRVDGDVVVTSGRIELGPRARIGGRLRYSSREEPVIDGAAQVTGGVERLAWRSPSVVPSEETARRVGRGIGWLWTVGLMLLAAALVALLPAFTARVAATVRTRIGWSALIGFVALVCIPVAAVLLMFTLIGLPLGLVTLFAYIALLPVAYVAAAIAFGDWTLARARPAAMTSTGWRIVGAVVAVLVLAFITDLPIVGWLIALVVLLIGIGALLLQFSRRPVVA